MCGDHKIRLGIFGFGAAAHIVAQIAVYNGNDVYAFTKPGDSKAQEFARSLGAVWAGDSNMMPPEKLDAAIIFAPAGQLVPLALRATDKGGRVVCGGIHMSNVPEFEYSFYGRKSICSVANLTREDRIE
jgi:propanol-preferring alcohol dehydrogenase